MYNKYKQSKNKKEFLIKYKKLLSAGGSDKPEKLLKLVGVDIRDEKFWQGGFDVVKNLIEEEYKIYNKI